MTRALHCPTCGARQEWSDGCRRCHADLTLLVAMLQRYRALRQQCLRQLNEGDLAGAVRTARQLCEISFDDDSARLLGTAYLLLGRFDDALHVHDTLY